MRDLVAMNRTVVLRFVLEQPRWLIGTLDALTVAPIYFLLFVFAGAGRHYGVGMRARLGLSLVFALNTHRSHCASTWREHIVMADALLCVPPAIEGDVAEFGCYRGMSAANLSLVCRLAGRRLWLFDSFAGLPSPQTSVTNMIYRQRVRYEMGDYCGSLREVQESISRHGAPEVCIYIAGYYQETLPASAPDARFIMVFEDADLPESVRAVLRYSWPRLAPGGYFFCHEARDREIVEIFYDAEWWRAAIAQPAPGLIGAGLGLPVHLRGSYLAGISKASLDY